MHQERLPRFRPDLERLEAKQLLSASPLTPHVAHIEAGPNPPALHSAVRLEGHRAAAELTSNRTTLPTRFLAFRITNTSSPLTVNLTPPFQQVLVQSRPPVPGQVYNVLQIAVRNGTAQTFTASDGFKVRLTSQSKADAVPILTSDESWKPDQWIVFYALSKEYYPVSPVSGGFQLDLGGASSTLVPGPSGIFLRLKYDPDTFARTLDWIVAYGPGAEGGAGPKVGLPDTAINEIVAASTHRIDFGGHF
jgi:hypothetical protein